MATASIRLNQDLVEKASKNLSAKELIEKYK